MDLWPKSNFYTAMKVRFNVNSWNLYNAPFLFCLNYFNLSNLCLIQTVHWAWATFSDWWGQVIFSFVEGTLSIFSAEGYTCEHLLWKRKVINMLYVICFSFTDLRIWNISSTEKNQETLYLCMRVNMKKDYFLYKTSHLILKIKLAAVYP